MHKGEYIFTVDNAHREKGVVDTNFSEHDPEHKSFNIIKLNNGQFAAQPNNRIIFTDQSMVHPDRKMPDFKVSTIEYAVESESKWTAGDDTSFFYEFKEQK